MHTGEKFGNVSEDDLDIDSAQDGIVLGVNASEDEFLDSDDDDGQINQDVTSIQNYDSDVVDNEVSISPKRRMDNQQGQQNVDLGNLDESNTMLMQLVNKLVDKRLQQEKDKQKPGTSQPGSQFNSPKRTAIPAVKSPSDTTLYRPGLQKQLSQGTVDIQPIQGTNFPTNNANIVENISNFVDAMCLESEQQQRSDHATKQQEEGIPSTSSQDSHSRHLADRAVIEVERFKASVAPPKGMIDDNDDDFFHVTCHVDANIIQKIEKGEFVDLDKLLPKDKFGYSAYKTGMKVS